MDVFKIIGSVFLDSSQFDDGVKKTETGAARIGDAMGKMGAGFLGIGAAVGTVAIAAVAGLAKMASTAIEAADETARLAEVYGMTAERVQELRYAGTKLDVELETILKAQTKLTKAMYDAKDGTGEQAEAFKALGVAIVDADGNLRDSKDVMADAFEALKNTGNEAERDALAMKIFGKSAMELNPLIKAGASELKKLTEEARKNGAVMSNDAVDGLDRFGDAVEAAKLSVKGIAGTMMSAFAPTLEKVQSGIEKLAASLNDAVKSGNFTSFLDILTDQIIKGVAGAAEALKNFMPSFVKVLSSIVEALVKAIPMVLPSILDATLQLLTTFIDMIDDNMGLIFQTATDILKSLMEGITANLPKLIDSAVDIVVELATGIVDALPSLIARVPEILRAIVTGITDNIGKLSDAAFKIIDFLVDYFMDADNLATLVEAASEIIVKLGAALVANAPKLIAKVVELVGKIAYEFVTFDWTAIGKSIVAGILEGMQDFEGMWADWVNNMHNFIMHGIPFPKTPTINIPTGTTHVSGTPMMANGGVIRRSGTAIVGEAGPEFLNLPAGASVTPLNKGMTIIFQDARLMSPGDIDYFGEAIVRRLRQLGAEA